eukprot:3162457-Prymnesium_polylepis.1
MELERRLSAGGPINPVPRLGRSAFVCAAPRDMRARGSNAICTARTLTVHPALSVSVCDPNALHKVNLQWRRTRQRHRPPPARVVLVAPDG